MIVTSCRHQHKFVFIQFKVIQFSLHHLLTLFTLFCNLNSASFKDFPCAVIVVSSSYSSMLGEIMEGRSLINVTKGSGPRIDPCGTPDEIHIEFDHFPLYVVP